MKNILLVICVVLSVSSFAQVSAGNDNVTSQGQITWSVGEVVTEAMNNSQGSTDSPLTIEGIVTAISHNNQEVSIYPNPVVNYLTVQIEGGAKLRLTDQQGKILFEGDSKSIDMSSYESGTYILSLLDENSKINSSFKLIKQ